MLKYAGKGSKRPTQNVGLTSSVGVPSSNFCSSLQPLRRRREKEGGGAREAKIG